MKTIGAYQREYKAARSAVERLEKCKMELERNYMVAIELIPADTRCAYLWEIEDDDAFEVAINTLESDAEYADLAQRIERAKVEEAAASEALIDYSLRYLPLPAQDREALQRGAKENYTTRQEIIALSLQWTPDVDRRMRTARQGMR